MSSVDDEVYKNTASPYFLIGDFCPDGVPPRIDLSDSRCVEEAFAQGKAVFLQLCRDPIRHIRRRSRRARRPHQICVELTGNADLAAPVENEKLVLPVAAVELD